MLFSATSPLRTEDTATPSTSSTIWAQVLSLKGVAQGTWTWQVLTWNGTVPEDVRKGLPPTAVCPMTRRLMRDPVIFKRDGQRYERAAIERRIMSEKKLKAQGMCLVEPDLVAREVARPLPLLRDVGL